MSNQDFEEALANRDNQNIIRSVCRDFQNVLSPEELEDKGRIALFKCLRKHDPSKNTKFVSSLYRFTKWECQKAVRSSRRQVHFRPITGSSELVKCPAPEVLYVRECLSLLPTRHTQILVSYYFCNMTLREIGKANGYSAQAAMMKLRDAERAFRRLYGED